MLWISGQFELQTFYSRSCCSATWWTVVTHVAKIDPSLGQRDSEQGLLERTAAGNGAGLSFLSNRMLLLTQDLSGRDIISATRMAAGSP